MMIIEHIGKIFYERFIEYIENKKKLKRFRKI